MASAQLGVNKTSTLFHPLVIQLQPFTIPYQGKSSLVDDPYVTLLHDPVIFTKVTNVPFVQVTDLKLLRGLAHIIFH